jgi:hypothetical protein
MAQIPIQRRSRFSGRQQQFPFTAILPREKRRSAAALNQWAQAVRITIRPAPGALEQIKEQIKGDAAEWH